MSFPSLQKRASQDTSKMATLQLRWKNIRQLELEPHVLQLISPSTQPAMRAELLTLKPIKICTA